MAVNNVVYDVAGYDIVTKALRELLNQFPGLDASEEISFAVSDTEEGISMFPTSGAIINQKIQDVTGHVQQSCMYPFLIMYKSGGLSENSKANVKEWLDKLGKWLERQEIDVSGVTYKLDSLPPLQKNMRFTSIERKSPSFLMETTEDKIDKWAINITAYYESEYDIEN